MKKSKAFLIANLSIGILIGSYSNVSAKVDTYTLITKDGQVYEYNKDEVIDAAIENNLGLESKLFEDFNLKLSKGSFHSYHTDSGKYVSHKEIVNKLLEQGDSKSFSLDAEAEKLNKIEMTEEIYRVSAKNGKLLNTPVKAKDQSTYKDVTFIEDLYVTGDKIVLQKLKVNGTLFIDPGAEGTTNLEDVNAGNIVILSGAQNSIHLKNVVSQSLQIESTSVVRIEASGTTKIENTVVSSSSILDVKEGSFGQVNVETESNKDQSTNNQDNNIKENTESTIEFRGKFDKTIVIKSQANIKAAKGAEITKLEIAAEKKENKIVLSGDFKEVVVNKEAKIEVANDCNIINLVNNANVEIPKDYTLQGEGNISSEESNQVTRTAIQEKILTLSSNDPKTIFEIQIDNNSKKRVANSVTLPGSGVIKLYATPGNGKEFLDYEVTGIGDYDTGFIYEERNRENVVIFKSENVNSNNPSIAVNYVNIPNMNYTTITSTPGPIGSRSINISIIAKDLFNKAINGIKAKDIILTLKDKNNSDVLVNLDDYKNSSNYNIHGVTIRNFDENEEDNILSFTLTFTKEGLLNKDSDRFSNLSDGSEVTFDASVIRAIKKQIKAKLPMGQKQADKQAANIVITKINSLPVENLLTLEDKSKVAAARTAYNELSKIQKAFITNLEKLIKAEAKISEIEIAAGTIYKATSLNQQTPDSWSLGTVNGNVTIIAGDGTYAELKDSLINGFLTIKGVNGKGGTVTLNNVKLMGQNGNDGRVIVEEVGEHSLYLHGVEVDKVEVKDVNGARIVTSNDTVLNTLDIIPANQTSLINLKGDFNTATVNVKSAATIGVDDTTSIDKLVANTDKLNILASTTATQDSVSAVAASIGSIEGTGLPEEIIKVQQKSQEYQGLIDRLIVSLNELAGTVEEETDVFIQKGQAAREILETQTVFALGDDYYNYDDYTKVRTANTVRAYMKNGGFTTINQLRQTFEIAKKMNIVFAECRKYSGYYYPSKTSELPKIVKDVEAGADVTDIVLAINTNAVKNPTVKVEPLNAIKDGTDFISNINTSEYLKVDENGRIILIKKNNTNASIKGVVKVIFKYEANQQSSTTTLNVNIEPTLEGNPNPADGIVMTSINGRNGVMLFTDKDLKVQTLDKSIFTVTVNGQANQVLQVNIYPRNIRVAVNTTFKNDDVVKVVYSPLINNELTYIDESKMNAFTREVVAKLDSDATLRIQQNYSGGISVNQLLGLVNIPNGSIVHDLYFALYVSNNTFYVHDANGNTVSIDKPIVEGYTIVAEAQDGTTKTYQIAISAPETDPSALNVMAPINNNCTYVFQGLNIVFDSDIKVPTDYSNIKLQNSNGEELEINRMNTTISTKELQIYSDSILSGRYSIFIPANTIVDVSGEKYNKDISLQFNVQLPAVSKEMLINKIINIPSLAQFPIGNNAGQFPQSAVDVFKNSIASAQAVADNNNSTPNDLENEFYKLQKAQRIFFESMLTGVVGYPRLVVPSTNFAETIEVRIIIGNPLEALKGGFSPTLNLEDITLGGDFTGLTVESVIFDTTSPWMAKVKLVGNLTYATGTGTITVNDSGWTGASEGYDKTAEVTVTDQSSLNVINPIDSNFTYIFQGVNILFDSDIKVPTDYSGIKLTNSKGEEVSIDRVNTTISTKEFQIYSQSILSGKYALFIPAKTISDLNGVKFNKDISLQFNVQLPVKTMEELRGLILETEALENLQVGNNAGQYPQSAMDRLKANIQSAQTVANNNLAANSEIESAYYGLMKERQIFFKSMVQGLSAMKKTVVASNNFDEEIQLNVMSIAAANQTETLGLASTIKAEDITLGSDFQGLTIKEVIFDSTIPSMVKVRLAGNLIYATGVGTITINKTGWNGSVEGYDTTAEVIVNDPNTLNVINSNVTYTFQGINIMFDSDIKVPADYSGIKIKNSKGEEVSIDRVNTTIYTKEFQIYSSSILSGDYSIFIPANTIVDITGVKYNKEISKNFKVELPVKTDEEFKNLIGGCQNTIKFSKVGTNAGEVPQSAVTNLQVAISSAKTIAYNNLSTKAERETAYYGLMKAQFDFDGLRIPGVVSNMTSLTVKQDFDQVIQFNIIGVAPVVDPLAGIKGGFATTLSTNDIQLGGDFSGLTIESVNFDSLMPWMASVKLKGNLAYGTGIGTITVKDSGWNGSTEGYDKTTEVKIYDPNSINIINDSIQTYISQNINLIFDADIQKIQDWSKIKLINSMEEEVPINNVFTDVVTKQVNIFSDSILSGGYSLFIPANTISDVSGVKFNKDMIRKFTVQLDYKSDVELLSLANNCENMLLTSPIGNNAGQYPQSALDNLKTAILTARNVANCDLSTYPEIEDEYYKLRKKESAFYQAVTPGLISSTTTILAKAEFDEVIQLNIIGLAAVVDPSATNKGCFASSLGISDIELGGDFTGLTVEEITFNSNNPWMASVRLKGNLAYATGTGTITVKDSGWNGPAEGYDKTAEIIINKQ